MHDDIIRGIFRRAETRRNTAVTHHGQRLNDKVLLLAYLARLILDEDGIPNADLCLAIYCYIDGTVPRNGAFDRDNQLLLPFPLSGYYYSARLLTK